jgi:hypothetical protein
VNKGMRKGVLGGEEGPRVLLGLTGKHRATQPSLLFLGAASPFHTAHDPFALQGQGNLLRRHVGPQKGNGLYEELRTRPHYEQYQHGPSFGGMEQLGKRSYESTPNASR